MTTRRTLLALALLTPTAAVAAVPAMAPVEALDQGILAVMKAAHSAGFAERARMFTPVAQSSFDLPLILRNSVGPRFANFSPAAQAELLDIFTQFTVASYVANFNDFKGERFETLAETRPAGTDVVVQTRLIPATGEAVKLDYVVHSSSGTWKIIDVLFNGSISRVAVQRSDFRALVVSDDPAPLLASLRDKVARLTAGKTN
jgi:phospholipid transport system substrate-binding protein